MNPENKCQYPKQKDRSSKKQIKTKDKKKTLFLKFLKSRLENVYQNNFTTYADFSLR